MIRSASWTRMLAGSFFAVSLVVASAAADDHEAQATAGAAQAGAAAAVDVTPAATDAEDAAATGATAATDGAAATAGEAAAEGAGAGVAAEPARPKCSHPHWNYCEAAGRCVQSWRCAAGTFPWPADNCECCARTALSGATVRCVECLAKSCVFPENCPDKNAALECRYEPPPVSMR